MSADSVPSVERFVLDHLPAAPCRVLEVGCGDGDLARHMSDAGYEVTAIDPDAPAKPRLLRTTIEDFNAEESFAAIVANRSLHHLHDLDMALEKVRLLLMAGGRLILNEFSWDLMDAPTARWYSAHNPDHGIPEGAFLERWKEEHADLHTSAAIIQGVPRRFRVEWLQWGPYAACFHFKESDPSEEARLIRTKKIAPLGYRLVAVARAC